MRVVRDDVKRSTYLRERELLGVGAALANALLDHPHGEALVGNALRCLASVPIAGGQVLVDAMKQELEALGGIAEASEWEAAAGEWTTGQGSPQRFRTESRLRTRLQLGEKFLE